MQTILNTSEEIWKPVKDYEGLYEVSNLGRVKSVERTVMSKNRYGTFQKRVREQLLKPALRGLEGDRYFIVGLHKNGVQKTFGVHQIVALSFPEICGLPFEGAQCNHIDEDHFNNTPENLNWLSVQDNNNHGTRTERAAKALSKTVYQYDKNTHELVKEWSSTMEVQRQMGWWSSTISECCNGKLKTAYGYRWSYSKM